jgi:hypothetical protein
MARKRVEFSKLLGKRLTKVEVQDDYVRFMTIVGDTYILVHDQDCCESVYVEDVTGHIDDLIGEPILMAEESNSDDPPNSVGDYSYTWTFYRLATTKGYVTIRWYGTSNGYYSESVSFYKE